VKEIGLFPTDNWRKKELKKAAGAASEGAGGSAAEAV
jgi:hypothetical protein